MFQNKIKIEWLTKIIKTYNSFYHNDFNGFRGSDYYEFDVLQVLKQDYSLSVNKNYIRGSESFLKYHIRKLSKTIIGDICIIDQTVLQFGMYNPKKINLGIVYHIDESFYSRSLINKLVLKNLIGNLKRINGLVVISQYWKDYFLERGVDRVYVIRCSYNIDDYKISDTQKGDFKTKYGLHSEKPLINIGPNNYGKGIEEVLENMDFDKFSAVATGKKKVEHPGVKTLFLDDDEYRVLLASCDVSLCMSTIPEGWNRVAHESLLAGTPVIGTNSAGMGELLQNSGQIILDDFKQLNAAIQQALVDSSTYAKSGFDYVSQFDRDYFEKSWLKLMQEMIGSSK